MASTSKASGTHPHLAPFVGRSVTIRYDPRDVSEIRVSTTSDAHLHRDRRSTPQPATLPARHRDRPDAPAVGGCVNRSTNASPDSRP
uniref:Mu transposase C-terminal domain-containing protein n=1 Tax=Helicobacter pylori TaxID=210 RepID=UPI0037BEE6D2